jgi:hypothetical protein
MFRVILFQVSEGVDGDQLDVGNHLGQVDSLVRLEPLGEENLNERRFGIKLSNQAEGP